MAMNLECVVAISIKVKMGVLQCMTAPQGAWAPLFSFYNLSSHMINIQCNPFEQKSSDSFISGELP